MEVWQTIKDAQDAKGWTNQKLAEQSGVPEPTLQKFLTGKTLDPRFDNVVRLCRALDLSVDHLCGIDSNAAVEEVAQLRRELEIARAHAETAQAKMESAETRLESQIHEYNQMVDAYEYRIHISKDRVIWLRNFLIFTCFVIAVLIAVFVSLVIIDVTKSDIGWLRSMSLSIGGDPHAKCSNLRAFFLI